MSTEPGHDILLYTARHNMDPSAYGQMGGWGLKATNKKRELKTNCVKKTKTNWTSILQLKTFHFSYQNWIFQL